MPDFTQEHLDDEGNIVRTDSGNEGYVAPEDRDQSIKDAEDKEKKAWEEDNLVESGVKNNTTAILALAVLYYFCCI